MSISYLYNAYPITPNFINYSDSYMPIIPSSVALMRPTSATVVIPGSLPLPRNFDLNKDERTHRIQSNYFLYKTLDKWIYDFNDLNDLNDDNDYDYDQKNYMLDLLNYFIVENGKVRLVNNLTEFKNNDVTKDTLDNIALKIDFIEKHILDKKLMHKILKNFVTSTGIGWVELHKYQNLVKKDIKKKLFNILNDTIMEREKTNQ